jgi:hypothetical protein
VAEFAVPTDVETAYEGSLPAGSEERVQYLLNVVSARLRLLMPTLEARIVAADAAVEPPATESDLAIMARDVVVQAVIRKIPGSQQQVQSTTQSAGPWSVTNRFTTDASETFPDDDLSLLGYLPAGSGEVGSIRIGRPDWSMQ